MKRFALSALLVCSTAAGCVYDFGGDAPARSSSGSRVPTVGYGDGGAGHDDGGTVTTRLDGGTAGACGQIDRFKELLVADAWVTSSLDARNDTAGAAFSFRSRMEELAAGRDAGAFVEDWLGRWADTTAVGPSQAVVSARPGVRSRLLEPWRVASGSSYAPPSLAKAPFRLLAIVNRLDLRSDPTGCSGDAGELRFVYSALESGSPRPLAATVIVELPYPSTRSPRAWASAWHDLARLDPTAYVAGLASLVRDVAAHTDKSRIHVRTNEVAFASSPNDSWELRQFVVSQTNGAPHLEPSLLTATPADGLDNAASLRDWLAQHEPALNAGVVDELPVSLQAGAASLPDPFFRWGLSAPIGERARKAFSANTCNGCHGGERPVGDAPSFQHIAPVDLRTGAYYETGGTPVGTSRISGFLNDPNGGPDELGRREKSLSTLLCEPCSASQPRDAGMGYSSTPSCR